VVPSRSRTLDKRAIGAHATEWGRLANLGNQAIFKQPVASVLSQPGTHDGSAAREFLG
jgi:hypothetical protein